MKVMEQQDPGVFPDRFGGAGCAHVNAVYVRVQSGSKINAVGSDSGLIRAARFWTKQNNVTKYELLQSI